MSRPATELAHLFRALKAPAAARALPKLADRARQEEWSYEQFAVALPSTEHASREAHGGEGRIRAARFPARKTLEEFDFSFQRSVKKTLVLHLGQLDFLAGKDNVLLLGPPGTGKTHLSIALSIEACQAGHRVAFAIAQQWVDRLEHAQHRNALDDELRRLERYHLLVVDEVGYLPLEREAANLLFALVARRYERGSIIVTSNCGVEAWGEILGDAMVATALIDRLIHHAHMVTLKGKSYRLRERTSGHPRPQTA
jgi:DNA replication protein DnaC